MPGLPRECVTPPAGRQGGPDRPDFSGDHLPPSDRLRTPTRRFLAPPIEPHEHPPPCPPTTADADGTPPPGIRVGSCVAPTTDTYEMVKAHQVPWTVNCLGLAFLQAAVQDDDYARRTWQVGGGAGSGVGVPGTWSPPTSTTPPWGGGQQDGGTSRRWSAIPPITILPHESVVSLGALLRTLFYHGLYLV